MFKIDNMIKKILLSIFFIIIAQATFAQEIFRVTSVNFDTANSLLFLTSPDNTSDAIMKNVKLTKLQNPKRAYFDINSAILTAAPQNWYINSGGIKQVKISQFSTNPSKIRVVLYLNENFDQAKISFLRVNNNIVIKFKDILEESLKEGYFQNIYREEHGSSSDFYENLSISSEDFEKAKIAAAKTSNDVVLNSIEQAFNSSTANNSNIVPAKSMDVIRKELKLKSKYYLDAISTISTPNANPSAKCFPNGLLINGFGAVGIEKPMYLTNPERAVFDIPNARINPNINNKEFKISENESFKVAQYEQNKVRIVITSPDFEKYFPIFASDGQSFLLLKGDPPLPDENSSIQLFTKTTDVVGYYPKQITSCIDEFVMSFNTPVVLGVKRENSKLIVNFYNALRYNDDTFRNAIKTTNLSDMKIDLLPQIGLKLTVPLDKDDVVKCYLGSDGKSVKINIKRVKPKQICRSPERMVILPRCNGKKAIVLDPGHGGSDYGAIRAGINEKDINLDIARRIQAILQSKGVEVYMTRDKDETVSLLDRTIFTANKCPNIFVSTHVNSSVKPEITGLETHYYHQESLELAQTVHASLVSYVKSKDRGLFKSKFYVINHTNVPAILVEIGFISNDEERAELVSEARKQQTANAIAEGILRYLNKK